MMFKRAIRSDEYDGNEETNKKVLVICDNVICKGKVNDEG
jgi:hypothetical protein